MKKIIATAILLFLWMNSTFAEVWWTITRSVEPNKVMTTQDKIYKKFANYSSESEFLKTEGQTCQVATDWCNTIMMWDWKFWGTTLMMCYWENGWEFKPQYSCIKYKWELSQNDQNQYDVFRKAVDKNFVSQLDKLVKSFDEKVAKLDEAQKREAAYKIISKIDDVLMEKVHLKYPQDKALPKKVNDFYMKLSLVKLSLSKY